MSAADLDVATRFLDALAVAATTGEHDVLYPLLAEDVEWLTPKRELAGLDAVRSDLTWVTPPHNLDLEFELAEVVDAGGGHVVTDVHETYRVKGSGDFAYACDRRIDLTIAGERVVRYEMRVIG